MKEAFFKDVLVPTGQLVELTVFLAHRHRAHLRVDDDLQGDHLAHQLWEPLNLVAAYALTNPSNLHELGRQVGEFQAALCRALDLGQTKAAKEHVAGAFRRAALTTTGAIANRYVSNLRHLRVDLPSLVAALYRAIDYSPSCRHRWLSKTLETATAVTRHNNPSGWRTLVRNSTWDSTRKLVGVDDVLPKTIRAEDVYGSREGKARLAALWADLFGTQPVAAGTTTPLAPDLVRLPVAISVRSNLQGRLEVSAKFDPSQGLPLAMQAELQKQTRGKQPAALRAELEVRQHLVEVDWTALADGVHRATAWLDTQQASQARTEAVVSEWLAAKKLEVVRKKLTEHFSEEERKLLSAALSGL